MWICLCFTWNSTFNSVGSKDVKKSVQLVKILSSWNTTCLFSPKQDRLAFLKNWLHGRLKATPVKYMLVHRGKPLYVAFSSNEVEFATCFCLDLEITGIALTWPTKAALICSLFFSVVHLAFLESVQLCYFYTCWKLRVCNSPESHNSDRERLRLLGMKETLRAPGVNDGF